MCCALWIEGFDCFSQTEDIRAHREASGRSEHTVGGNILKQAFQRLGVVCFSLNGFATQGTMYENTSLYRYIVRRTSSCVFTTCIIPRANFTLSRTTFMLLVPVPCNSPGTDFFVIKNAFPVLVFEVILHVEEPDVPLLLFELFLRLFQRAQSV